MTGPLEAQMKVIANLDIRPGPNATFAWDGLG